MASVPISTAVCSLFLVFNLALCAMLVCVSSWWQIEETLSMVFLLLKPVETSTFLLGVSCLEQSIFPIFPHVWSELDEQALLVLQGFSSQLVHFSAFEAVIVTLWVTLDAICQKAYEIVVMHVAFCMCGTRVNAWDFNFPMWMPVWRNRSETKNYIYIYIYIYI
ncbi:hypothetical protein YC2023_101094 [Brassica napus]